MSEDREQQAIIRWAQLTRIPGTNERISEYLIHIPNGGKRNPREAAKFKKMGVVPGVSDLFLAYPTGTMHGLWIELKRRRRDFATESTARMAVTEHQQVWLKRMSEIGYFADVCYGFDEATLRIKSYLGIPL